MVVFSSGSADGGGVQVVALDGATGEVGFDRGTEGGPLYDVRLTMTDSVLLGGEPDDGSYTGFSLADGRSRWTWRTPDGCQQQGFSTKAPARDTVLVAMACVVEADGYDVAGDVTLVAIDDRTGQERWRHEQPFRAVLPDSGNGPRVEQLQLQAQVRVGRDGSAAELT